MSASSWGGGGDINVQAVLNEQDGNAISFNINRGSITSYADSRDLVSTFIRIEKVDSKLNISYQNGPNGPMKKLNCSLFDKNISTPISSASN